MKKLWTLATIFTCAVTLFACGNDSEPNETEGEPTASSTEENEEVTFRFSWWGGDARHAATQEIIDLYMEENDHVTIEPHYGAWNGWQEQFSVALVGGQEPDLMQINYNWLELYSSNGDMFYDLEELSGSINLANYDQEMIDIMRTNGVLQGIPTGMTARVPYLNATLYESAGIDRDELPTTWDELLEAGRTIQAELGEDYFALSKLGNASASYLMFSYLEQTTGEPFITEAGELNYDVDQLETGFQLIQDFIDNGVMPHGEIDSDELNEMNQRWIEGRYGGINEWDSNIDRFVDTVQEGQEIMAVPHFRAEGSELSGIMSRPSMGFAISRNTEHPEEVAKFLDFLVSDPRAVELMGTDRGIPANKVAYDHLVAENLLDGIAVAAHELHMNAETTLMHPLYENPMVREIYETAIEEVQFGALTPRGAAERVAEQTPSALEEGLRG